MSERYAPLSKVERAAILGLQARGAALDRQNAELQGEIKGVFAEIASARGMDADRCQIEIETGIVSLVPAPPSAPETEVSPDAGAL